MKPETGDENPEAKAQTEDETVVDAEIDEGRGDAPEAASDATAEVDLDLKDKPFTMADYDPSYDARLAEEDAATDDRATSSEDGRAPWGGDDAEAEYDDDSREAAPRSGGGGGGGFMSTLLGGVAAAAVGAGAVVYGLPQIEPYLPAQFRPSAAATAPAFDPAPLQAALDAQSAEIADLKAQLAALPAPAPAPAEGASVDLGPFEDALSALRDDLSALDARVLEIEKRPVDGGAASATAIDAFERELADLREQFQKNRTTAEAIDQQIAAATAEMTAKIKAAEDEAAAMRASAAEDARKARAEAAVAALTAAVESDAPAEMAKAQLAAAGVDLPAALKGHVPTIAELTRAFEPAARVALGAARKEAAGDDTLGKLGAFFLAQTGARSLEPAEGNSPDAILARAGAATAAGDMETALAEVGALPPAAQAALSDWTAMAQARLDATKALADLAQSVN